MLRVLRLLSQMVALVLGELGQRPCVIFSLACDCGSSTISPSVRPQASTETLFFEHSEMFMPLYRNCCDPCPGWLLVPSHVSHPIVHPLLRAAAAAGVSQR